MPQLDFSTYPMQAFWLIVSFCLLWRLVSMFITPKIADIIEQRKRKIHEYIYNAELLNARSKSVLEKYEKSIAIAKNNAIKDIEKAQKETETYLQEKEQELSQAINNKIAESEIVLAKEKTNALQNSDKIAQQIALEIINKLGISNANSEQISKISRGGKFDD